MFRREALAVDQRLRATAVVLTAVTAAGFLYLFNPNASTVYPTCPFLALTGCYCPGCGSLRALHQLLHGHALAAFGLNPLMVLSAPFVGYSLASYFVLAATGRTLQKVFVKPGLIRLVLGCIILFGVLRNVPVYPFTTLAP